MVDGEDMTKYDNIVIPQAKFSTQDDDDFDTMNDLELELASQTGRLTGN